MNINKYLYIFSLIFLTACGGGGDSDDSDSEQEPISKFYTDNAGDTPFDFIDMTTLAVTVTDDDIFVDIDLFNIPDELLYNNSSSPLDALEYDWTISFDADHDGTASNDIQMSLYSFNEPTSTFDIDLLDPLLDFAYQGLWLSDEDQSLSLIGDIDVVLNGSTLTLAVSKDSNPILNQIDITTPVKFSTFYNLEDVDYLDFFPNDESYAD